MRCIANPKYITFGTLLLLALQHCAKLEFEDLHRKKRQLLWPNSTLLQFNAGIGTPTPVKTIQANWAFQANFQLPWNRSQIPTDIFFANSGYTGSSRKKRDAEDTRVAETKYENDARLYHLYIYVEDLLDGFGHNGTACVLQTLCQLGREPLHSDDEEDLLHELATFALNPNHDIGDDQRANEDSLPYIEAYNHGARDGECAVYDGCRLLLIDMFTKVHNEV